MQYLDPPKRGYTKYMTEMIVVINTAITLKEKGIEKIRNYSHGYS